MEDMKYNLGVVQAAAGFPSPADDWLEEEIDMNKYLGYGKASTFLVKVEGCSMEGLGIADNSTLVVDRALKPVQGSVVLAVVENEFTVRKWQRRNGRVWLEAAHPEYPPLLTDGLQLEIWGVVTHCIRKYVK